MMGIVKTSEAVLWGHPDKLADSISDAILDKILTQDSQGRVAVETLVTGNHVVVAGEISAKGSNINVEEIVRQTCVDAGYTRSDLGFDAFTCKVTNLIQKQSSELSDLQKNKVVAGDQGIMTGYATSESPDYLPLQFSVARNALFLLASAGLPEVFTDAKALAAVEFPEKDLPVLRALVISVHNRLPNFHELEPTNMILSRLRDVYQNFMVIPPDFSLVFNPAGPFTIGGPAGDTGLTGRKIVVDQYGGEVPVGGGAFSGKDPTKVDRSASYYARYLAKTLVATGMCSKALVRVSYVIGQEGPYSVTLDTFGTNVSGKSDAELINFLLASKFFDFRVANIIKELHLQAPIYLPTAQVGSFGNDPESRQVLIQTKTDLWKVSSLLFFPWEKINSSKVLAIQNALD